MEARGVQGAPPPPHFAWGMQRCSQRRVRIDRRALVTG